MQDLASGTKDLKKAVTGMLGASTPRGSGWPADPGRLPQVPDGHRDLGQHDRGTVAGLREQFAADLRGAGRRGRARADGPKPARQRQDAQGPEGLNGAPVNHGCLSSRDRRGAPHDC